jgi:hypothetical protein
MKCGHRSQRQSRFLASATRRPKNQGARKGQVAPIGMTVGGAIMSELKLRPLKDIYEKAD